MSATKDTSTPTTSKTASSKQAPAPTPTATPPQSSSEAVRGKIVLTIGRQSRNPKIEILSKGVIPLGYVERAFRNMLLAVSKHNNRIKKANLRRTAK